MDFQFGFLNDLVTRLHRGHVKKLWGNQDNQPRLQP